MKIRKEHLWMSALMLVVLAASTACTLFRRPRQAGPTEQPTRRPTAGVTATALPQDKATPLPSSTAPPQATQPPPQGSGGRACADLGSTWSGGTAPTRSDGTGFDVSACARSNLDSAELVKPAERDPERWGTARCNDGSPFAFEVQLSPSGQSLDWVIYLDGGGFCEDNAKPCVGRIAPLMSSPQQSDRAGVQIQKRGGVFNREPNRNSTFHDANMVFAYYCSSDQWTGATGERRPTGANPQGWYFSGRLNVTAMIEALMERYGLDDANPQTRVLFSGGSAGGFGVLANADILAGLLPQTAAAGNLNLLDDGGFAADINIPGYSLSPSGESLRETLERAYDFWGAKLNPLCEQAQVAAGQHPGRCSLGPVVYPFIVQPPPNGLGLDLLIQQCSIDSNAMELYGIDDPQQDAAAMEQWRATYLAAFEGLAWVFSGGAFPYHTILTNDADRKGWNLGPDPDHTLRAVVTRFFEGGPPEQVIFGNP